MGTRSDKFSGNKAVHAWTGGQQTTHLIARGRWCVSGILGHIKPSQETDRVAQVEPHQTVPPGPNQTVWAIAGDQPLMRPFLVNQALHAGQPGPDGRVTVRMSAHHDRPRLLF